MGKHLYSGGKKQEGINFLFESLYILENREDYEGVINTGRILEKEIKNIEKLLKIYGLMQFAFLSFGRYAESEKLLKKEIKIAKKYRIKGIIATAYSQLANTYFYKGDIVKAEAFFNKSLKIALKTGGKTAIFNSLFGLGMVNFRKGIFDKAENLWYDALKLARELDSSASVVKCLTNLGILYFEQKKYKESFLLLNKSLKIARENKLREREASILQRIAYQKAVMKMEAKRDFEKVIRMARERRLRDIEIKAMVNYGYYLIEIEKDIIKAGQIYTDLIPLLEETQDLYHLFISFYNLYEINMYMCNIEKAYKFLKKSFRIGIRGKYERMLPHLKDIVPLSIIYGEDKRFYKKLQEHFKTQYHFWSRALKKPYEIDKFIEKPSSVFEKFLTGGYSLVKGKQNQYQKDFLRFTDRNKFINTFSYLLKFKKGSTF